MKKGITTFLLLTFLFTVGIAQEQPAVTGEKEGIPENDPIAAMLDSLVSLNFLTRHNSSHVNKSGAQFSPEEIPMYSDSIYRIRLSKMQTVIPMDYNQYVKDYIQLYAYKRRELTGRVLGLSRLYFPLFEEVLDRYNFPIELKHLAIVESALNPVAVSRMGATGLWQFMYTTGKLYDLKVNSFIDERRDPYQATVAACEYFKDMYEIYKDWLLVIAAYNCGPGNVNRAILRSGGKRNFWEIRRFLPAETRGYVPAFIAVNYVMNHASEHNITPVTPAFSYFEVDTVGVNKKVILDTLAAKIEVPLEVLQYLNPPFKKNFIPQNEQQYTLRLPAGKISSFITHADEIFKASNPDDLYEYVTREVKKIHTVRNGEYLTTIAKKYDCSITDIKQWNRLKSNQISPGRKLTVYTVQTEKILKDSLAIKTDSLLALRSAGTDSALVTSDSIVAATAAPAVKKPSFAAQSSAKVKYIYHTVQPGDTLWNLAQRYNGTVEKLKTLNKITNSHSLKPGTKLKVGVAGS